MDINKIRFSNYQTLMKEFVEDEQAHGITERGSLARFGAKCGIDHRYLSHINTKRKNIGDKSARAMEQAFRRPHGWLDADHTLDNRVAQSEEEKLFVQTALRMFRQSPTNAQAHLLKYMADRFLTEQETSSDKNDRSNVKA